MNNEMKFLSFYISDHMYGLEIQIAKEVHPDISITEVPLSKDHIRGLVNIRGQIVLVMDISVIFGHEPILITDDSQLVILKTAQEIRNISSINIPVDSNQFGDKPVAFLVDRIGDVITIQESMIEPAPPHLPVNNAAYVKGVVKLEDNLFVILNAEEMLNA